MKCGVRTQLYEVLARVSNHWVSELRRLTGLRTRRHQPYCVWWVYWLLYMASKRPCCTAASTSLYVMMIARVRMCGRRFLIEVMLFHMACRGGGSSRLPHMCSSATTKLLWSSVHQRGGSTLCLAVTSKVCLVGAIQHLLCFLDAGIRFIHT